MNQEVIFIIGIVIFAITVAGSVMAGGMALTKVMVDQEPPRQPASKDGPPALIASVDERHP